MTMKEFVTKGFKSSLVKAVGAGVVNSLLGSHEAEDSSTSATSSAWAEIEHKLRDLFGSEQERRAGQVRRQRLVIGALFVLAVLFLVYLFGRRQGRGRETILEVRKA